MKVIGSIIQFLLLITIAIYAWADSDWTITNTQIRKGNKLQVVCIGTAPSGAIDLARSEAMQSCRNTAISHLQTNLTVKTLTIETERDVSLHSETIQNSSYTGLDCKQDKEKIQEDKDGGIVTVYLRCNFDLAKTKVMPTSDRNEKDNHASSSLVKSKDSVSTIPVSKTKELKTRLEQSDRRHLIVQTIPSCDEILIRSDRARIVKCEPPTTLLLYSEDTELIIRLRGHKPKHLRLNKLRTPANYDAPESVELILEKL